MITLTVNGKPREAQENTNLATYLSALDVNMKFVAVGYNGQVIKKDQFSQITLSEGDTLEIVRPVGGG
jgi:sulfur carrier protein